MRITRIPPPTPCNVSFISCMGERISRERGALSDYQKLSCSAQNDMGASREELEVFSNPTLERILDGIRYLQREIDGEE